MSHTLAGPASGEQVVKHSRFLAQAAPVASAAQARAFIEGAAIADASHNCWAWRVGAEYRSNDDGEPSGTAGRPILAAIDGQRLDRVAVVVTRWFGGTKLGAGGLVRAYGGCAAECLRTAARTPLVVERELVLRLDFEDMGAVHAILTGFGAAKLDEAFAAEGVQLRVRLAADRVDALRERLRDATRDRVRVEDR